MSKRIIGWLLAGFMLAAALATYVADQIYVRSLPVVETVFTEKQTLRNTDTIDIFFQYRDEITLRAPETLRVDRVFVEAGDSVQNGDVLLTFNADDIHYALLSAQILAEDQEKAVKKASPKSNKRTLREMDLAVTTHLIEALQALEASEGKILSPANGYVVSVRAQEDETITANAILLTLLDSDGAAELTWQLDNDSVTYTSLNVMLPIRQGSSTSEQQITFAAGTPRYSAETNRLVYTVALDLEAYPVVAWQGQAFESTLRSPARTFDYTLPKDCLYTDDLGDFYIYLLMEKETARGVVRYVKKRTIQLLDEDDTTFAVSYPINEPVIRSASQELEDLMEVRILE